MADGPTSPEENHAAPIQEANHPTESSHCFTEMFVGMLKQGAGTLCSDSKTFQDAYDSLMKINAHNITRESVVLLTSSLLAHCEQHFTSDFVFLIIVGHYLHISGADARHVPPEIQKYLTKYLLRFDKLNILACASSVSQFMERLPFNVKSYDSQQQVNVSSQLRQACLQLAECSRALYQFRGFVTAEFVFTRFVWGTLAVCFADSSEVEDIWKRTVITHSRYIKFDLVTVDAINKGLQFGKDMNLPKEKCFMNICVYQLYGEHGRGLEQFRNFVSGVHEYLDGNKLAAMFALQRSLPIDFSVADVNLIRQVITSVNCFYNILCSHGLHDRANSEVESWIKILVSAIDIRSKNFEKRLKLLFPNEGVCILASSPFKEFIITEITEECIKNTKSMNVRHFHTLAASVDALPRRCFEHYVSAHSIPMNVDLSQYNTFFHLASSKFKGFEKHQFLLDLLKKISRKYEQKNKATDFILHCLKLDGPNLFQPIHMDEKDENSDAVLIFFREYIKKNHLKMSLLKNIPKIINAIASWKSEGYFQLRIISVLCKQIVPNFYELSESEEGTVTDALTSCSFHLAKKPYNWCKYSRMVAVESFCVDFVVSCCESVVPDEHSLNWIPRRTKWLKGMCKVYSSLRRGDHPEILSETLKIAQGTTSQANSYLQWILKIRDILLKWRNKYISYRMNYDELCLYDAKYNLLATMGECICILEDPLVLNPKQLKEYVYTMMKRFNVLNSSLFLEVEKNAYSYLKVLENENVHCDPQLTSKLSICTSLFDESCDEKVLIPLDVMAEHGLKNPYMRLKCLATVADVDELISRVQTFLQPVLSLLDMLVFFMHQKGELFKLHLENAKNVILQECATNSQALTPAVFCKCLQQTSGFLNSIYQGTVTYSQLTCNEKLNIGGQIDNEIIALRLYAARSNVFCEGLEGLKYIFELRDFHNVFDVVLTVCQQCEVACSSDTTFQKLKILREEVISLDWSQVDINQAANKMGDVLLLLHTSQDNSYDFLELFESVAESPSFIRFIKEKGFIGSEGQSYFMESYELVTAQLQHQDYPESVLNHLWGAFKLITPFMTPHQTYSELMTSVAKLDKGRGVRELFNTVNQGINHIKLWFSKAEGEAENLDEQLNWIIECGEYVFLIDADSFSCSILLQYPPRQSSQLLSKKIRMNIEQVSDFIRRLGFLDKSRDSGEQFQSISEISFRMKDIYTKLVQLGHRDFSSTGMEMRLPCSQPLDCALMEEERLKLQLNEWESTVQELKKKYQWLLFFHLPKIKRLYELIVADNPSEVEIFNEVSFLCSNDAKSFDQAQESLKKTLKKTKKRLKDYSSSLHTVGKFLKLFFKEIRVSLPRHDLPASNRSHAMIQTLHCCYDFTYEQLIRLTLGIFDGFPRPYNLLICNSHCTKEEISLFLSRTRKISGVYVIIQVNILPYELQEFLMTEYIKLFRSAKSIDISHIHFIEADPSILRSMAVLQKIEHEEPKLSISEVQCLCKKELFGDNTFSVVELVYGCPGDGKTHYIMKKIQCRPKRIVIPINEAFLPIKAIAKLRSVQSCHEVAVVFNFTIYPSTDDQSTSDSEHLQRIINWFFFQFFIIGYVEDISSGQSFQLPRGLNWCVYIEVPSQDDPANSLKLLIRDVPIFGMICSHQRIESEVTYDVNDEVQLVCKYLNAFRKGHIDRMYSRVRARQVKFSCDPDLSETQCHRLMDIYMPEHVKKCKLLQKLFIKYMKRRCKFLDNFPAYNFNIGRGEYNKTTGTYSDTSKLGSTLMETMLKEVGQFCDPGIKLKWSSGSHEQLIYDFMDNCGTMGLISLHPDLLEDSRRENYLKLGVNIPDITEASDSQILHGYLSRAFSLKLDGGRIPIIKENKYVLTLDYTIKMLNIHERFMCGSPVIIEGETGVGKTALVEILSKLWNQSLLLEWKCEQLRLRDFIQEKLNNSDDESSALTDDILHHFCKENINDAHKYLTNLKEKAITAFIERNVGDISEVLQEIRELSSNVDSEISAKVYKKTAKLLDQLLDKDVAPLKMFYKINIHSAMTPEVVLKKLQPAFDQANLIKGVYESTLQGESALKRVPYITLFLDEVNTSSCTGLFKEIIVDRTLDGNPVPDNLFIVAACNPHRGDSMASHEENTDSWVRGNYCVRKLPSTLDMLKWDYGALSPKDETMYIISKMEYLHGRSIKTIDLVSMIGQSQQTMREYAFEQLKVKFEDERLAKAHAESCVSQRDIQRVFDLYLWFKKSYDKLCPQFRDIIHDEEHRQRRALLVSLGLVYYLRLNTKYRKQYKEFLDAKTLMSGDICFSRAFEEELDWYIQQVKLPDGSALTQALKENVFATIVCTVNRMPLIIVGAPGSSKTFSFNQVIRNLKGEQSIKELFRDISVYPYLDPHPHQCSRRTTSIEIEKVFLRAITRQEDQLNLTTKLNCVVFMDEAGLPEEKHESLKVLHSYLDERKVSFVAITNNILDAAKTNRAISLFRPTASKDDLKMLVRDCFRGQSSRQETLSEEWLVKLSTPYFKLIRTSDQFSRFYGLRDFMHFIKYLSRTAENCDITPQLVSNGVERNFNGSDEFNKIVKSFLKSIKSSDSDISPRGTLTVLKESVDDHAVTNKENEARYLLIIDPSEDDSVVRLLFSTNILNRKKTKIYLSSQFSGDGEIHKVNTIATIRHSVYEGHTVLLSQTDDIHESFYDLFNQNFRQINQPNGDRRFYANIAIGSHHLPCKVHEDFRCVVIIKSSEAQQMPAPFLNRFEKYFISHKTLFVDVKNTLPKRVQEFITSAVNKAKAFVECVSGESSLYGFQEETVESLFLTFIPSLTHEYHSPELLSMKVSDFDANTCIMQGLINAARYSAGFEFLEVPVSSQEFSLDSDEIFTLVLSDSRFQDVQKSLASDTEIHAVRYAMDYLFEVCETTMQANSCDIAFIISIFQQWTVRCICKRLMQIMTPESLVLHHKSLPSSYIENYLRHQHHFNLKDLISHYQSAKQVNKVVCFTRISAAIHHLPSQYPVPQVMTQKSDQQIVKSLVSDKESTVVIRKLSTIRTQKGMEGVIKDVLKDSSIEVCVLIANLEHCSKKIINHVRILIEEIETSLQTFKLFIILLCFPPSQFFHPMYPSLYLKGWDHYYLDKIGDDPTSTSATINIQDWFLSCLQPGAIEMSSLTETVRAMLPQSVSEIVSHVYFGSQPGKVVNSPMSVSERSEIINDLLQIKGMGEVLCEKFCRFWKPQLMLQYLEETAKLSVLRESTVCMTDSIYSNFKKFFFDFSVYIFSQINTDWYLDVICNESCSGNILNLHFSLLRVLPTPPLSKLNSYCSHFVSRDVLYTPEFPFFRIISEIIDELVEQCHASLSKQFELNSNSFTPFYDQEHMFKSMTSTLKEQIQNDVESPGNKCLNIVFLEISKNAEFWNLYLQDFIVVKLNLESHEGVLMMLQSEDSESDVLMRFQAIYEDLQEVDVLERMVALHVHYHIYNLDYPKIFGATRFLHQISEATRLNKEVSRQIPSELCVKFALGTAEHIANKIIDSLLCSLLVSMQGSTECFENWFHECRKILSLPMVKNEIQSLYHPSKSRRRPLQSQTNIVSDDIDAKVAVVQAKVDLIQVVFILLISNPMSELLLQQAKKVFQELFQQLLNNTQAKTAKLLLPEVIYIVSHTLTGSMELKFEDQSLMLILMNLVAHFFSWSKKEYDSEDICWFLEMINEPDSRYFPMNMKKLYLNRILGRFEVDDTPHGQLPLFKHTSRSLVGKVLFSSPDLGSPGPYLPLHLKTCTFKNISTLHQTPRMQQHLAHLYFLVVLERLTDSESFELPQLIIVAENHRKNCDLSMLDDAEKMLLHIELQAVMEVTARHLAQRYISGTSTSRALAVEELLPLLPSINKLQKDDEILGTNGSGLALAFHIYRNASFTKLRKLLSDERKKITEQIHCLLPIKTITESISHPEPYRFSFMLPQSEGQMASLYRLVRESMIAIHEEAQNYDVLLSLAKQENDQDSNQFLFRMMVFLVAYYEFFFHKKTSQTLYKMLDSGIIQPYLHDEYCTCLIKCFLDPQYFCEKKHLPEARNRSLYGRTEFDPIYDFFTSDETNNADLRHSLANLVATILGCPPRSSHLWYHMFEPEHLHRTFMTGHLLTGCVGRGGYMYDCGLELTADGLLGRTSYNTRLKNGNFTLNSLYFLLWANFGCFCIGLLTQREFDNKLIPGIFSSWQPLRHYCFSYLNSMWLKLQSHLCLSEEERPFFVVCILEKFFEVIMTNPQSGLFAPNEVSQSAHSLGVFNTLKEVECYEKKFFVNIFSPTYAGLKEKFTESMERLKESFISELRKFEILSPHFPVKDDIIATLTSTARQGIVQYIVQLFERLRIGEKLLPRLVEFYQWLHTQLAYTVTTDVAKSLSISKVMELAQNHSSKQGRQYLQLLYKEVINGYNEYAKATGGGGILVGVCRNENEIAVVRDETSLLHFLTTTNGEQDAGWLYAVISDIVYFHNEAIKILESMAHSEKYPKLSRIVPDELPEVSVAEFSSHHAIITTNLWKTTSELVEMIRGRYWAPLEHPNPSSVTVDQFFHLREFEEDVALLLVLGKPKICSPDNIRTVFKFKMEDEVNQLEVVQSFRRDLEHLRIKLDGSFIVPIDSSTEELIQLEFNGANYNIMLDVLHGLKIVAEHLIKELSTHADDDEELYHLTVIQFLLRIYRSSNEIEVIQKIGVTSLGDNQQLCISRISLLNLIGCIELFTSWIECGYYDFCNFSAAVKDKMSDSDISILEATFHSGNSSLVTKVGDLLVSLKDPSLVADIERRAVTNPKMPVVEYLIEMSMLTEPEDKEIIQCIPENITLCHYVHLIVTLRRILIENKHKSPAEMETTWNELSDDFLTYQLPPDSSGAYFADTGSVRRNYGFSTLNSQTRDLASDLQCTLEGSTLQINGDDLGLTGTNGKVNEMQNSNDLVNLSSEASNYTIEDLAGLMVKININHDVNHLLSNAKDFSARMLLDDEASVECLEELGITEVVDQLKLLVRFRQDIKRAPIQFPVQRVLELLHQMKLECYSENIQNHSFDGDMFLCSNVKLVIEAMKTIGISSALDRLRILVLFRNKLQGDTCHIPADQVSSLIEQHSNSVKNDFFDGDMLLFPEDTLVKEALKEIGVKRPAKVRSAFKIQYGK